MSRSGYSDDGDGDGWSLIRWRGAVSSASRGRRGQSFFKELLAALDEMPNKRLIADELIESGEVCAIGALGLKRSIDMKEIDPEDPDTVANKFNIAPALAREVVFMNDEGHWNTESPEERFVRVRSWVEEQILKEDDNG